GYSHRSIAHRQLKLGDILLEKSGGGPKAPVGRAVRFVSDVPSLSSNFISTLRPASGHDSRYWAYLLADDYARGGAARYSNQSTGIQNLDVPEFLARRLSVPSIEDQRRIADYLDRETAEIDAFIADQRQMLVLLHERMEATIVRMVAGDQGVAVDD